ncbi:MAG: multiheme c-type cytochrome [Thermoguttaceae bacterium]
MLLLCLLLYPIALQAKEEEKHPVYVGSRVCASCHRGRGMGHQFSKWLQSKHARAYAVLAHPEAKEIARLSGIPQEPQESAVCLGCHATGAEVEDWEKDDTFVFEDGVQCEKCHGPGSEYADEEIMTNPKAAEAAGLILQTKTDCQGCHQVKGSHVAVLGPSTFDVDDAMKQIEHATPQHWDTGVEPRLPSPRAVENGLPAKYTGAIACGECHQGPDNGYQLSRWHVSKHALAYASLATPSAEAIAREAGIQGDPQKSPACLKCHTTSYNDPAGGAMESYAIDEGVGCEACHGAGGEYSIEVVMEDPEAAAAAGLKPVTRDTCLGCHRQAHGKPFDYETASLAIAHPTQLPAVVRDPIYKTPLNLAISPNGRELFVACEASHSVIVVDTAARRKVAEIQVGHHATEVAFSPDGTRAYVSNRLDDTVSVIQVATRKVLQTIPVGDEPHGLLVDRRGKNLYVLNTSVGSISVIDTASLQEIKRLSAGRYPWSMSMSPDGSKICVTNALSHFVEYRTSSISEVTVIDTDRVVVEDRAMVRGANLLLGVDWHPSGRFALVTLNRTKNLVPMTRLLQGWTVTNGLGIVWADGRIDQVLLDEPGMSFPDPTDVAVTPDGRLALVTSSGSDRIAVVDVPKLIAMLDGATPHERENVFPNHLGKPTEFIIKHIPTEQSPRGIVIARDGTTAYVANSLNDSLTVIDLKRLEAVGRIDLGGPREITKIRWGERIFHSADSAFHRQFSCHTCHPDGHVNGLTYDIEPDGLGISPVDNRTLRGILDTSPFKWEGTNPSLSRQCGARLAVFFTRIQPFTPDELSALVNYICTIPRPPNRYRPLGAELTDTQRRGKAVFERTRTNGGRAIPREQRCFDCHFPPLYTNRTRVDVGTKTPLDREADFDVPHLSNIYDSAPYLHNGLAETLEEIWTRYNPYDQHGVTNDLTKDQLNDLIEYIKTL